MPTQRLSACTELFQRCTFAFRLCTMMREYSSVPASEDEPPAPERGRTLEVALRTELVGPA